MKAIYFKGHNIEIAKDQPEYQTLPAYQSIDEDGVKSLVFCFKLDADELKQVKDTGMIFIKQLIFNQNMQPLGMSCLKEVNLPVPAGDNKKQN